jgi:Flp pilus assembly protein TadD
MRPEIGAIEVPARVQHQDTSSLARKVPCGHSARSTGTNDDNVIIRCSVCQSIHLTLPQESAIPPAAHGQYLTSNAISGRTSLALLSISDPGPIEPLRPRRADSRMTYQTCETTELSERGSSKLACNQDRPYASFFLRSLDFNRFASAFLRMKRVTLVTLRRWSPRSLMRRSPYHTHSSWRAVPSPFVRVLTFVLLFFVSGTVARFSQTTNQDAAYQRGAELARAGNFEESLKELKRAAQSSPKNPRVFNMLGVVLTQLGRLQEANEAYGQALALAPNFLPARRNRAVNSFTRGDFGFAASEFEALAQLEPKDFVPKLFLGLLAMEELDFPKARRYLLEAQRLSRDNTKVLLALTRVHFTLGERSLALQTARDLQAQMQSSEAERFELGVTLAQFEANTEAVEVFDGLWHKKPGVYDVGFNLALVQYRAGQLEAALRTLEQLSSSGKSTGEVLNLRGWIYNKMRQLDRARESLQLAIQAEPNNPDHYLDLSTVLTNEGDREAAIRVLSEGLEHHVQKDRLQVQMGLIYQKNGAREEAERWYREALHNPSNQSAYLALAHLMSSSGRQSEALDLLKKGVQSLPTDALLHYMYGGLLLEAEEPPSPERLKMAESILRKALELNPLYANTHYVLGKLYASRGDYTTAESFFQKACSFNPNHAGAYYQLSVIARRQGRKEEAERLGKFVAEINQKADKTYQESFAGVVQESLQGHAGGSLVTKAKP